MADSIRILLADDHPMFLDGVAHSLGSEPGFEVIARAASGEEAVELAQRLVPDVALLDITMPGMGGIAAAASIAASAPGMRIVMLTVSEDKDNLMAALKAGAHGYVLKGAAASELRAIVRRVADGESFVTPALGARLLAEFSRPRVHDPLSGLTAREAEVIELLSQGLTNREIGAKLHLAEKTIKHYVTRILQKLQARSRTEVALIAARHGSRTRPAREARPAKHYQDRKR
ncbi:MAG: DNA-binding response regulator [Acidobacteria bacterium RIFCSPLOWO2_12_FULL_67_14b]|nr:MAG: DNA-binding response regulator [Acidobacteria bacterium RIFCSPLOWO2_12_FULL_67_14b]OFZ83635.1 MAG: DNA-binding response regulator [Betaproteobacteria bacterium RBG_16_66_20]